MCAILHKEQLIQLKEAIKQCLWYGNNTHCEFDFWNELPTQVKQALNKEKAELDRGEGVPHSQIMAELKTRFLNK